MLSVAAAAPVTVAPPPAAAVAASAGARFADLLEGFAGDALDEGAVAGNPPPGGAPAVAAACASLPPLPATTPGSRAAPDIDATRGGETRPEAEPTLPDEPGEVPAVAAADADDPDVAPSGVVALPAAILLAGDGVSAARPVTAPDGTARARPGGFGSSDRPMLALPPVVPSPLRAALPEPRAHDAERSWPLLSPLARQPAPSLRSRAAADAGLPPGSPPSPTAAAIPAAAPRDGADVVVLAAQAVPAAPPGPEAAAPRAAATAPPGLALPASPTGAPSPVAAPAAASPATAAVAALTVVPALAPSAGSPPPTDTQAIVRRRPTSETGVAAVAPPGVALLPLTAVDVSADPAPAARAAPDAPAAAATPVRDSGGAIAVATARMGTVEVAIDATAQRAGVHFGVETGATAALLNAHQSRLEATLAAAGSRLDMLSVDVRGGGGEPRRHAAPPPAAPPDDIRRAAARPAAIAAPARAPRAGRYA